MISLVAMKYTILFTIITFFVSTSDAQLRAIDCVTQPLSSSYLLRVKEKKKVELTIIHHNGIEHAPLLNGVITQYTFPLIQRRFLLANQMGASYTVEFDLENCNFKDNNELSCAYNKPAKIGSLAVFGYYFFINKEVAQTSFGEFEKYILSFEYRMEDMSHPVRLEYSPDSCSFNRS